MKIITFLLVTLFTITVYCQNGITFSVENLAKPEKHFYMRSSKTLYEELILSDVDMSQYQIKKENIDFPYDKDGKRNNLKKLKGGRNLPEEIVKIDLQYIDRETGLTIPLELWAGFIGLEQNKENYALTPKIGWMIRKKDLDNIGLKKRFESDWRGISIRVTEIPSEIFEFKEIESLRIAFIDRIIIPDQLAKIKIGSLILSGKIDKSEIKRIRQLFPNINLEIN